MEGSDFPGNYGVVLKDDDLVIDADPRNFLEGDNPVERFLTDSGLPLDLKAFTVRTGGGGLHIYLKKPVGYSNRMLVKEYKGIELKSKGHYLVGPGSIHPDSGLMYEVLRGNPVDETPAPPGLLALCARGNTLKDIGVEGARDDEGTKQRYATYLKNTPEAIQHFYGDIATFKVAAEGYSYGLSAEVIFELMAEHYNPRCVPPWPLEDLRAKVINAFNHCSGAHGALHPEIAFKDVELNVGNELAEKEDKYYKWTLDAKRLPKANDLGNTVNYCLKPKFDDGEINPLFRMLRYNEFADQIEFNFPAPWHSHENPPRVWTDDDARHMKYWLSQERHYITNADICYEAAIVLASGMYRYHPVKQYLNGLVWDGKPRLDYLLSEYAQADDNVYTRAVGKNTVIAAVSRIFQPGCQFDHILILEGKQGTGKSSFVRVLGGGWYRDIHLDPHNKDTIDAMKGGWIIEASEMEFARRADVQALKAFITRIGDFVRPAYARTTREFPRQCVIIGTTNPEKDAGYLRDTTGNRRFWPVKTGVVDLDRLKTDRDQLWAEAVHRYRQGENFYLDSPELVAVAEIEQAERTARDPWLDLVSEWQYNALRTESLPEVVTSNYVAQHALGLTAKQFDRTTQQRVSHILVTLEWERGKFHVKEMGKTVNAFRRNIDLLDGL